MTLKFEKLMQDRLESALENVFTTLDYGDISQTSNELLQRNKRRLAAALVRIEKGSYGICCDCGDSLSLEELEADPAAPFCAYCSTDRKYAAAS